MTREDEDMDLWTVAELEDMRDEWQKTIDATSTLLDDAFKQRDLFDDKIANLRRSLRMEAPKQNIPTGHRILVELPDGSMHRVDFSLDENGKFYLAGGEPR